MFHDGPNSVNYLCQTGYGMVMYLMDNPRRGRFEKNSTIFLWACLSPILGVA
jgi:hypothetical protein